LESLRGEQTRCTMGQMGPTPAHALEGKPLIGEAHSRPPDLPDPQTQGSIVWEPESINSKTRVHTTQVRRPILDEGARVHPDPWPSLGVVTINLDVCSWSASQLEGEQNIHIPCVGSELHAAPSAPQTSTFSPFPPDAPTHENPPEEGAATERRATDYRHPEPWKPPDAQAEDLQEAGGVPSVPGNSPAFPENIDPFGLAGVVANVDAEEVEPSSVDAHERGGTLPVVGAATALAEGTASVEPAGEAQRATVAKSEALVPWAQGVAKREVERPWREDERELEAPLQTGRRKHAALPPERERERGTRLQGNPYEAEREPGWPPQEPSNEDVLSIWERAAPWDPGEGPAGERILESRGPVEAMDITVGIDAHNKNSAAGIDARKRANNTWLHQTQSEGGTITSSQPRTYSPSIIVPIHRPGLLSSRSRTDFVSRPIQRAQRRPGRCRGRDVATRHRNTAVWRPSHTRHAQSHASPHLTDQ